MNLELLNNINKRVSGVPTSATVFDMMDMDDT